MKALDYLLSLLPYLPTSTEGGRLSIPPSKGTIKRWLQQGAVVINGETPAPQDEISFPIWELVFFPKSKRRVTMVQMDK